MLHTNRTTSIFKFIHRKSREHMGERILKVWDNGRRNIKLNHAKFIDMSRDFAFNVVPRGVKTGL